MAAGVVVRDAGGADVGRPVQALFTTGDALRVLLAAVNPYGFGLLAAPAADLVARHLPWVSIAIGLNLVVAGGWTMGPFLAR